MEAATKIERNKWYVCTKECENELPKQYIKGHIYECVTDGSVKGEDLCSRLLYDTGAEFREVHLKSLDEFKKIYKSINKFTELEQPKIATGRIRFDEHEFKVKNVHILNDVVFYGVENNKHIEWLCENVEILEEVKIFIDVVEELVPISNDIIKEYDGESECMTFDMFGMELMIVEDAHPGHNWCTMCALDKLCDNVKFTEHIPLPCQNSEGKRNRYFVDVNKED